MAVFLAVALPASGQIRWTDKEGTVHVSSELPSRNQVTEMEWRRLQILPTPTPAPVPRYRVKRLRKDAPLFPWLWYQVRRLFWEEAIPFYERASRFAFRHLDSLLSWVRWLVAGALLILAFPFWLQSGFRLWRLFRLPRYTDGRRVEKKLGKKALLIGSPRRASVGFDPHARNLLFYRKWIEHPENEGAWTVSEVLETSSPDFYVELDDGVRVLVVMERPRLREPRTQMEEIIDEEGMAGRLRKVWMAYPDRISVKGELARQGGDFVLGVGGTGVEIWPRELPVRYDSEVWRVWRIFGVALLALVLGGLGLVHRWGF